MQEPLHQYNNELKMKTALREDEKKWWQMLCARSQLDATRLHSIWKNSAESDEKRRDYEKAQHFFDFAKFGYDARFGIKWKHE